MAKEKDLHDNDRRSLREEIAYVRLIAELEDYLGRVKSHPGLFSVTVPVGKGEEVSLRLE